MGSTLGSGWDQKYMSVGPTQQGKLCWGHAGLIVISRSVLCIHVFIEDPLCIYIYIYIYEALHAPASPPPFPVDTKRVFCGHEMFTFARTVHSVSTDCLLFVAGQGNVLLPEATISSYPSLPTLPSGFLPARANPGQNECHARILDVDMPRTRTALGI